MEILSHGMNALGGIYNVYFFNFQYSLAFFPLLLPAHPPPPPVVHYIRIAIRDSLGAEF